MSQSHKFPKRTSSKQTSGLFEPGFWVTTHWWKEPHQESHKLKVLLHIYWELMQHLGRLTAFIVSAVRWVGYWSVRCIGGGGGGLSLWVINCCASAFVSDTKKREKNESGASHFCRVQNRNELSGQTLINLSDFPSMSNCDWWTLQVIKQHIWSKKEEKETLSNLICLLLSFELITKHIHNTAKIYNHCLAKDSLRASSHACFFSMLCSVRGCAISLF